MTVFACVPLIRSLRSLLTTRNATACRTSQNSRSTANPSLRSSGVNAQSLLMFSYIRLNASEFPESPNYRGSVIALVIGDKRDHQVWFPYFQPKVVYSLLGSCTCNASTKKCSSLLGSCSWLGRTVIVPFVLIARTQVTQDGDP